MHTIRDTPKNMSGIYIFYTVLFDYYVITGLCALSHANETALIAYPGSIQVSCISIL